MANANNVKVYVCKGCKKELESSGGRSHHHKVCELALKLEKNYSKATDGKFKCSYCELVLAEQSNRSCHVKKQHLTIKTVKVAEVFDCKVCKKSFGTRYKIRKT